MDDVVLAEAKALVEFGRASGMTFGFAESCTAGLVASAVGSVPGASETFAGSIVSYMLSVKERVLGVSSDVLYDDDLGPVSEECALLMAKGAQRRLGTDVAVSVTGIAGPGGGEPGKPVGTVWFACATDGESIAELRLFDGSRDEIRNQAACFALRLAHEGLVKAKSLAK